jgi:phosphoribosylformylglycinamidine cyclo-ligase
VAEHSAPDAFAPVAPHGRRRRKLEQRESPSGLHRHDEIDIFHHRHVRNTADLIENAATYEDSLVAEGKRKQPDPKARRALEDPHARASFVEAQTKGTSNDLRIGEHTSDCGLPSTREAGVGMQKHDDLAMARPKTRLKLLGSPARRFDDPRSRRTGQLSRGVKASPIDDQHLRIAGRGTLDRILNNIGLVERGYHHRDIHVRHDSMLTAFPFRSGNRQSTREMRLTGVTRLHYSCRVSTPQKPDQDPSDDLAENAETASSDPAGLSAPTYAAAGVDLDHDESFIDEVKEIVRGTTRPEVLSSIGGFAGMFKTPERYKDPIWVAATDGVGTKLSLARQIGRYDTIGIDCVAMVVNDLVVQGAEPVIFLDYLAMSKLDRKVAADALRGIAEGCKRAGCALLGGETATMPGVYQSGDIEVVGFSVGVVERSQVIDGSSIREGDALVGLASSGFHSNGYSLVRHVLDAGLESGKFELFAADDDLNTTLASALLSPTRIYVKPILNVIRDFQVNGIIHITGGGFAGNIPRILPNGVQARIDTQSWPRPGVYPWIQKHGELSESEMLRVFNCGIGMVLVVPNEQLDEITQRLSALGERAYVIGSIERREPDGPPLVLDPGYLEGS